MIEKIIYVVMLTSGLQGIKRNRLKQRVLLNINLNEYLCLEWIQYVSHVFSINIHWQ